jgi:hypothetical protein
MAYKLILLDVARIRVRGAILVLQVGKAAVPTSNLVLSSVGFRSAATPFELPASPEHKHEIVHVLDT